MSMISEDDGWRVEFNEREDRNSLTIPAAVIENPEASTSWFLKYFLGRDHSNYICEAQGKGSKKVHFALSFVRTPLEQDAVITPTYRVIIWQKDSNSRCIVSLKSGQTLSAKELLKRTCPHLAAAKDLKMKHVTHGELQKKILYFEQMQAFTTYKFGVLLMKEGQNEEEEMFQNNEMSEKFQHFLDLIGDKIELQGFDKFRGGLDVKDTQTTGQHSYYTTFGGYEVMFHVSTLLPYQEKQPQQVERKRHLGNDVCCIIFQEGDCEFRPNCISSHFNHIFAVVQIDGDSPENYKYKLACTSKDDVRPFGPQLPSSPTTFSNAQEFRSFILAKLINGERAAMDAPAFSTKLKRTAEYLLSSMWEAFFDKPKGVESADELREMGQRLRVASAHGELRSTESINAVSAVCLFKNFPATNLQTGDYMGNGHYLIGTDECLLLYNLNRPEESRLCVRAQGINVVRISAIPELEVVLLLHRRGKKQSMLMYTYAQLLDDGEVLPEPVTVGRSRISDYAVGDLNYEHYLVQSHKNMLYYLHWEDAQKEFVLQKDYVVPEAPDFIALHLQPSASRIIVAFRREFDSIDVETGAISELHAPASTKVTSLCALFPTYGSDEILLCYDTLGLAVKSDGSPAKSFDLRWTAIPKTVAYVDPYVLAITHSYVEVRAPASGSVLQTLFLEDVRMLGSTHAGALVVTRQRDASSLYLIRPTSIAEGISDNSSALQVELNELQFATLR